MILIDGNSLMYRAYFGIADTSTLKPNSKGVFTNAIMSFARMMNHILQEQFDNIFNSRLASAFIYAFCTTKLEDIDIKAWGEYK